jgi:hypothetical protein
MRKIMNNQQDNLNGSGKASWEDPSISFSQNIKKNWRTVLPRLFGPAGSLIFHILILGVLISITTTTI